jgi:hypothetical protein
MCLSIFVKQRPIIEKLDKAQRDENSTMLIQYTTKTRLQSPTLTNYNAKPTDFFIGVLTPLSAIFQLYHGDQF